MDYSIIKSEGVLMMITRKQNHDIKSQLFTAQISLILISIISFFILSSVYLYVQNMNNVFRNIEHAGELTVSQLDRVIAQLENTVYYISVDTEIPSILASTQEADPILRQRNRNTINNTWTVLQASHTYPVEFTLYADSDNQNIFFDGSNFCTMDSIESEDWYHALMSSKNRMLYHISTEGHSERFSIISKLFTSSNYTVPIGILRLSVDASVIKDALRTPASTDLFSLLVDTHNTFISPSDDFTLSTGDVTKICALNTDAPPKSVRLDNGRRYFAIAHPLDNQNFRLYTLCCVDSIHKTISVMLLLLMLILVVVSVIAFLISWRRSLPFVNAFNTLSNAMKKMNLGDFKQLHIPADMDDNIVETYSAYNHLMTTVTNLIQYNADYEASLKKMELDFLQQQIKPHFLYNTLNTMQGLVKEHDLDKVLALINSLSKFYRFSLHNSDSAVTLATEIKHITHYVTIENFKFNNAITLNIDLPEDVLCCKVPRLTLQPLIENAVHHGIREKACGTGTISISHERKGQDIFIYILDDGVGIPAGKIDAIKHGRSIGYSNTDRRIRLYFGEGYGLDIESEEGAYTKIIIKIKGGF